MNFEEFRDKLMHAAHIAGFKEYELYYVSGESFRVGIFQKEVDSYTVNSGTGLSFRGLYNDKMGYAYTEILDEDAINLLVESAKSNAIIIENDDKEFIFEGSSVYSKVEGYSQELSKVSAEEKITLALELEEQAFKQSDKVKNVKGCMVQSAQGLVRLVNSKGLELINRSNIMFAALSPVIKDGEKVNNASAYKCTRKFGEINAKELAEEAVGKALAYIGAQPVKSGLYKIAFKNDVACDILETFSGIFSADNVQKGKSILKGKLGKAIASKKLTLIDDPLLLEGLGSMPFDAEGVATYTKEIIREGELMTYLYNLKTAQKDGVKTTGNASKASYASPVDTAVFNFYVKPGTKGFEELLEDIDEGLLITELQGLHSGANEVSGDFSLGAKGFLIKNGKKDRPVDQITVAGNFYKLLEDVEEVGSDLKFEPPSSGGCFGSPTIILKELSVAGN